jgi:hypothetical protein
LPEDPSPVSGSPISQDTHAVPYVLSLDFFTEISFAAMITFVVRIATKATAAYLGIVV